MKRKRERSEETREGGKKQVKEEGGDNVRRKRVPDLGGTRK